jgi:hypothetical protein
VAFARADAEFASENSENTKQSRIYQSLPQDNARAAASIQKRGFSVASVSSVTKAGLFRVKGRRMLATEDTESTEKKSESRPRGARAWQRLNQLALPLCPRRSCMSILGYE